jgi:polysaccharide biosynthesis protein PslA
MHDHANRGQDMTDSRAPHAVRHAQEAETAPDAPLRVLAGRNSPLENTVPMRLRSAVPLAALGGAAMAVDLAAACLISWIGLAATGGARWSAPFSAVLPFLLLPAFAVWGLKVSEAYGAPFGRRVLDQLARVALGAGAALAGLTGAVMLATSVTAVAPLLTTAAALWLTLIALHAHGAALARGLVRAGRLSENVIIVGATDNARRLIIENAATRELNIVGVFDDRLSRTPIDLASVPVLGRLDDLLNWEHLPEIDRIIVTVSPEARVRVKSLIERLRILPQRVVILLDYDGLGPDAKSLAQIAHSAAAYVSGAPRDLRRAVVKRLTDIGFAIGLALVFSPVLLATALAIRLDSPGPIFFRQRRHGFNNQVIRVWKFRSMRDDKAAETCMQAQTTANDPRVTRVGCFIRSTSLDELPQLLNVLKGEMSIVGPRPHAIGMTAEATLVHEVVGDYAHRHRVKPGITGWAQINGSRGPVHAKAEVRERIRLDLEYVNRSGFWLDLYIMLMTAPCLLGDAKRHR